MKPVEEVACFLSRGTHIVQIGHRRDMELGVEVPRDELGPVASNEMWGEVYDRLAELIRHHRATLVFVKTHRAAAPRQPVAASCARTPRSAIARPLR